MDRVVLDVKSQKNIFSVLCRLFSVIRYRFFLFAGIFPYLLGQAIAFNAKKLLDWGYFWWGFLGIFLVLIGVEFFNEYFDAKGGGDRIFSQVTFSVPHHFFALGIFVFTTALFIALYLAFRIGWPVLLFSFLGFLASYFYVAPPIRWAYRGLGELMIAISYGPLMVLGSYFLQTKRVDFVPFVVSLVGGLLIFSLAILNEIPDYFQDKLVGKRNIVVRSGRRRSAKLFSLTSICSFALLGLGIWWRTIPYLSIIAFLMLPLVWKSIRIARDNFEQPHVFAPAIKIAVFTYVIMISSLGISYLGAQ